MGATCLTLPSCPRPRLHPNAEFMEAILTGRRQYIQAPAAS
jgi:hypothetical protein